VIVDHNLYRLFGLAAIGLVAATASSIIAAQFAASDESKATAAALKARVTSSWVMSVVMMGAILVGRAGPLLLSTVISILGLVEMFRLMPRRAGDHEVMFWCLVVLTPLQYFLVAMEWHELFTILVPGGAFVLIPGRIALAGDFDHFFERVAKLQWAVMLCVYCLSHACALLTLSVPGYQGRDAELLVFFILVMAVSDVMQYATGKLFGSRKLAPRLRPP
jgi:phosphatidate cytidylyltransferase